MNGDAKYRELAERIVEQAVKAGATEAEAFLQWGERVNVQINRGRVENLTCAGSKGIGLRVFVHGRLAFMSSSDFDEHILAGLVHEAVSLASEASPEPYNVLPDPGPAGEISGLDDPELSTIPLEKKIDCARKLDALIFEQGPEIQNTEGAVYSDGRFENLIVNSRGLAHRWKESFASTVVSPVAGKDGQKQVAHSWSSARRFRDLKPLEEIAAEACRRARMLLGGEAVPTQKVPVVMDFRAGATLFEGLAYAVNGESVYRDRSFLADKLGKRIGSDLVNVVDDGTLPGGMGSSPVDGEGVPTSRKYVVRRGVLASFLYDTYTARKANTTSTGNAARNSYASRPVIGGLNFYLEAGDRTPEDIISEIDKGFYVFRTMGGGPDAVTGDFSAGAAGVWIEGGKLTRPVAKVTIAAGMLDMLAGIDAVANDLILDSPTATPTYRIREMMVSGV
ncbi:MAG: TldD/PmbA family protein [Candidatus Eisenbacteria sp.]|nr:TldD/PmbA family protein [Candidatus Eisenbacteria bacterium]